MADTSKSEGAQAWFVVVDPEAKEKIQQVIQANVGSTNYNALQAGQSIIVNGQPMSKLYGPYSTQSAAESQASQQQVTLPNAIPGLAQIGDFFGTLTQASTWERVGQVVLGAILIAVGIARLTDAVPAATQIAKTVGAAAIL
jgi:hypothetical protein